MGFSVTNQRNGSQFIADKKETILDAALRDNRIYPYGCRNGVCGACKCSLLSGTVDYGEYEDFALSDEEKREGKFLACQATALEDIVIDADEVMVGQSIQIKMLPCRVGKIERLADDVICLFLMLPKTQEFNFIPGQYIDIILKDGQRRSFSIGNLPEDAKTEGIELHIRLVPDGHFTPRVFESIKQRDLMRFEGPFGTYFFQSEPTKPVIMIAGGTGFSPIKGLFEQAMNENPNQSIHLFWGARDQEDLYMGQLVEKWLKKYPNLKYTPVLSENNTENWIGATGWVHDAVCEEYESFEEFDVYASGPPIMVNSVRDSLSKKNMHIERFFFDSFDFAPQN
ncbi:MAG: 2Fe-2S iron-sulfur cluster binding domain-containing protein [Gammaproteobacteria bacterium]|nr:2Fe-2S iron-sulfur cluster binding domain-containing protein [Gammaproteobacteria bacterium]